MEGSTPWLELLLGISGAFRPKVLTCLMGVTGAGKPTLMDVLAGRKTGGSGYTSLPLLSPVQLTIPSLNVVAEESYFWEVCCFGFW